mmetsp:Transcript_48731/g.130461  ORF Transcript_48731/g.130461 Transcript_48731/m.130461 type:complete len:193 (-) Transcript_48731:106-684(-)
MAKEDSYTPMTTVDAENSRIGLDHHSSNADASSSLGLIATLVFSMCIGAILELNKDEKHPIAQGVFVVSVSLSTATSLFTMAFAVLDYFYSMKCTGIDSALADQDARASLRKEVDAVAVEFRDMNLMARNSMWTCLFFLVVASTAHICQHHETLAVFIVSLVVLILGVVMMIVVVMKYRGAYIPIIKKYRWN